MTAFHYSPDHDVNDGVSSYAVVELWKPWQKKRKNLV